MTKRLEDALRQLRADQLEKVADFAELLARQQSHPSAQASAFLRLDWIGMAADAYPEHASGVEAAHAAGRMIGESIERALPK
jgi:hypothetical protein